MRHVSQLVEDYERIEHSVRLLRSAVEDVAMTAIEDLTKQIDEDIASCLESQNTEHLDTVSNETPPRPADRLTAFSQASILARDSWSNFIKHWPSCVFRKSRTAVSLNPGHALH